MSNLTLDDDHYFELSRNRYFSLLLNNIAWEREGMNRREGDPSGVPCVGSGYILGRHVGDHGLDHISSVEALRSYVLKCMTSVHVLG